MYDWWQRGVAVVSSFFYGQPPKVLERKCGVIALFFKCTHVVLFTLSTLMNEGWQVLPVAGLNNVAVLDQFVKTRQMQHCFAGACRADQRTLRL
jgi:hypothetical protein